MGDIETNNLLVQVYKVKSEQDCLTILTAFGKEAEAPYDVNKEIILTLMITQAFDNSRGKTETSLRQKLLLDMLATYKDTRSLVDFFLKDQDKLDNEHRSNLKELLKKVAQDNRFELLQRDLLSRATQNTDQITYLSQCGFRSKEYLDVLFNNKQPSNSQTVDSFIDTIQIEDLEHIIELHIQKTKERAASLSDEITNRILRNYSKLATDPKNQDKRSGFLLSAINSELNKLVCYMTLNGFKLDKKLLYENVRKHGYNGSIGFLSKYTSSTGINVRREIEGLTDNDLLRMVVVASAKKMHNNYNLDSYGGRAYFFSHNKKISPLMMAIKLEQYDIAAELVKQGHTLKASELLINVSIKSAVKKLMNKPTHEESASYVEKVRLSRTKEAQSPKKSL